MTTLGKNYETRHNSGEDTLFSRAMRLALQSEARRLLAGEQWRVLWCLRHIVHGGTAVMVEYVPERKKSRLTGLMRCGSVFVCAWCAWWASESHRQQIARGIENLSPHAQPIMSTYTLRHKRGESLSEVLGDLLSAYRDMVKSSSWRALMDEYGLIGSIKALEVTYGEGGWHPHLHVISFVAAQTIGDLCNCEQGTNYLPDMNEFSSGLQAQVESHFWIPALKRYERTCERGIGLRVTCDSADVAGYLSKFGRDYEKAWTVEKEASKSMLKEGRRQGKTPFELLYDSLRGDSRAGALFVEYARAMEGKASLRWSPGLQSLSDVASLDDWQAARTELDGEAIVLAAIPRDVWAQIVRDDRRAELLNIADHGDSDLMLAWLGQFEK